MPNTVVLIIAIKLYFQSLVLTARYGKRKSLLETKKSYHKLFVFIATYKTKKKNKTQSALNSFCSQEMIRKEFCPQF